jgi:hypothetical protein
VPLLLPGVSLLLWLLPDSSGLLSSLMFGRTSALRESLSVSPAWELVEQNQSPGPLLLWLRVRLLERGISGLLAISKK